MYTFGGDDVETASTYQGELTDNGVAVNVDCVFDFSLWNAEDVGTQIGPTPTPTVTVVDGRFTVQLDFGDDSFQNSPRFPQTKVCCPSSSATGITQLVPRQELTPAPYALALPGLRNTPSGNGSFTDNPNVISGHHDNSVGVSVAGWTVAGGVANDFANSVAANFGTACWVENTIAGRNSTVAGGATNTAIGFGATIGRGTAKPIA